MEEPPLPKCIVHPKYEAKARPKDKCCMPVWREKLRREWEPGILVVTEKHSTRYFIARTWMERDVAALQILTERLTDGWYYEPEEPKSKPDLTLEQAQSLPNGVIQDAAFKQIKNYVQTQREFEDELTQWLDIKKAVLFFNAADAWRIIRDRSKHEYERVTVEHLENWTEAE